MLAAIGVALFATTPAAAQARIQLQGIVDGELWATDTSSNLLARNAGQPFVFGRAQIWGAIEPVHRLVAYGLFETRQGSDTSYETGVDQYGVRYTASHLAVVDAGKITSLVGTFAARRFSNRNPLIGVPDGYPVQYPLGVELSGAARLVDYRVGVVSLPVVHDRYTPPPTASWRPALGLGITPFVGVRLGGSFTAGPYLNDDLTATQLAQRDWKSYKQRIWAADVAVSVGYAELVAEGSLSSYDVPNRPDPVEGATYYVEGKYTFTPRLFAAARLGRNDYPFISPVSPTFWVARKTDFHDEELGVGFRLTASTLAKLTYRRDHWNVDGGNQAFVRPGGRALAVQLSQSFDVMNWIDGVRARGGY